MIPHEQAFFVCDSYLVTTTGPYLRLLTAQGELCAQKEPSVLVGVKKKPVQLPSGSGFYFCIGEGGDMTLMLSVRLASAPL